MRRLAVVVAVLVAVMGAPFAFAHTSSECDTVRAEATADLLVLSAAEHAGGLTSAQQTQVDRQQVILGRALAHCPTPTTTTLPPTTTTTAAPTTTTAPTTSTTLPPTTTTTTPPTGITHGQQINASNTGINGAGLTVSDLTTQSGGTFSTNGQVLERRRFTGTVTLSGSNQVLRDSIIEVPQDANAFALRTSGTNIRVENVLVRAAGAGGYICIYDTGTGNRFDRVDSSNCENTFVAEGDNMVVNESYFHDPESPASGAHHDVVEVFTGTNQVFQMSRFAMGPTETSAFNVAPWHSSHVVNGVTVQDCFLDGGNFHFIFDNQGNGISNARVLRNRLGGNTGFGGFIAYRGPDGNDPNIVRTASAQTADPTSVLWPTSGPDVNVWSVEAPLSPNLSGQVVQ